MAWDLKSEMAHRSPIVGWSNNWISSSKRVIRELQQQGKIAWTVIINATMAIVSQPEHDVKLKQVEAFRDSIIAFNQRQNKTKVHMGGTYVDRIVLSKRFFAIDFLEHDRVFWEKFHEREEQASDFWAQGSATAGNEVMVHCQNFPKSVDVIKDLLENTITPYLVKVMAQHQMVMEPSKCEVGQP